MHIPAQLWAEIDLDAITHNVQQVLEFLAAGGERPPSLMAVIKGDAYGHGAVAVAGAVLDAGAHWLGVTTLAEAVELREAGIEAPILVFNPPLPDELTSFPAYRLTATVADLAAARRLAPACHLKVDTGLGRFGADVAAAAAILAEQPVQGIYTHLGVFDLPELRQRFARFRQLLDRLQTSGHRPCLAHAAASSSLLLEPATRLDLVRAGNLLYGVCPEGCAPSVLDLRDAWRLRARVIAVRQVPGGARVGYGAEHRFRRPARVAVVPAGFADGVGLEPAGRMDRPRVLLRRLARLVLQRAGYALPPPNGGVAIRGRPVNRVGRQGMAHTLVDATAFPDLAPGEPVTLYARRATVNARVPRVYLRDGLPVAARAGVPRPITLTDNTPLRGEMP
ncbi:MAG TPA: alanine racemase [Bacillota bacterium]|nr:alanine racemase [Bacillota bacterium]